MLPSAVTSETATLIPAGQFLETERRAHSAAAAGRCVAYVENPEQAATLDAFVSPSDAEYRRSILVVHGESGCGKSSLLSFWSRRRAASLPAEFLIAHFVGATGSSTDHVDLIRRVILEIRGHTGVRDEVPASRPGVEEAFPRWLGFVQSEQLVLIVDGLDQLDARSRDLVWLPPYLQPRVRLIVSTNDPAQVEALKARGADDLPIHPLQPEDRLSIARRHIDERRSAITERQLHRIAFAPASANPLFLRTSLEEVRAGGRVSRGHEEHIEGCLAATSLQDLHMRMLARVEAELGTAIVKKVLGLLWASRRGLTAEELGEMTRRPPSVAAVVDRVEFHLISRDEHLSISHQEFRNAVIARYVKAPEDGRALHRELARYFARQKGSHRAVEELPWQLSEAGDSSSLVSLLSDVDFVHSLYGADDGYELLGYLLALGKDFDAAAVYARMYECQIGCDDDVMRATTIGIELGETLQRLGKFEAAVGILRAVSERLDQCGLSNSIAAARTLQELGAARLSHGDLAFAERDCRAALDVADGLDDIPPEDAVKCRRSLAEVLYTRRQMRAADRLLRDATAIAEAALGRDHELTLEVLTDLGAVLVAEQEFDEAENILRIAVTKCESRFGTDDPRTAHALNNLAAVLDRMKRTGEAIALVERAAEANRRALGPASGEYFSNLNNLAVLRRSLGDLDGAERGFRDALAVMEDHGRSGSLEYAYASVNLGRLLQATGHLDEARMRLESSYTIRLGVLGASHSDTLFAQGSLYRAYWALGDYSGAEEICRDYARVLAAGGEREKSNLERANKDLASIVAREVCSWS